MAITERGSERAEARMQALREVGHAVAARYDRHASRIVVSLNTGVQLAVPVRLVEGLAGASAEDLAEIEIRPAGLGLHWPKLDADVYTSAPARRFWLKTLDGRAAWRDRRQSSLTCQGRRIPSKWPQRRTAAQGGKWIEC
jgi:hypothetical protein